VLCVELTCKYFITLISICRFVTRREFAVSISSRVPGVFNPYVTNVIYTGCPRRKGKNFGRVLLMLKYTDITQNTYVQS
jgi:hypothetical protein